MVEYRLAKARVAGSNPVSRLIRNVRKASKIKLSCFFISKIMCTTSFYVLEPLQCFAHIGTILFDFVVIVDIAFHCICILMAHIHTDFL